ncbi:MAG TPA: CaiB/BaiF CoA-transferase family protein, partial [Acidimicrobiales bacterium]|nr:CaiB/BaiF CoA-transferase family protein [Acidimicrobiales bacterium]
DRADKVVAIDPGAPSLDVLNRGRRSIGVNLKDPEGVAAALDLIEKSDALIEGFRPGVMERLGLGPEVCLERNPRLIYGRMTGWGQDGPMAEVAGHDINYLSLTGALAAIGRAGEPPVPPLNLVADFGGGGMVLALGIAAALVERQTSGKGQVIDAAMVDGVSVMMSIFHGMTAMGIWSEEHGTNMLDSGAHWYDAYETADGKYVSVGPVEPQFYALLLDKVGLDQAEYPHFDKSRWPELKERFTEIFKTRTRDEWCELLEGTDACFAPVLTMSEAPIHPHNVARGTFVTEYGVPQAAPAPRFSRTPGSIDSPPPHAGEHTGDILAEFGFAAERIETLRASGAVA